VKLTIGGNGRVSAADVVSGGDGKSCVAEAVKKVTFPEFSGDPMSVVYPFIVR
ncbi:energy transducer TonB, partial [Haliangium sp. UPWRP_2]